MNTIKNVVKTVAESVTGSGASFPPATQARASLGDTMTTLAGAPIVDGKNSLTAGPMGPVVMQDVQLLEKINQFAREKIPARNVHALGFGGFGKFTVTNDITKYSSAKIFSKVGNSCNTFTRFSGVFTEQGDPETLRDLRGWATKFYTEEGNWDILTVNTPAFNARDMKVGPDAIHAFKRDPRNAEWYSTQTWDFVANHPEALQTQLMIYTDRIGTPMSMRKQNWFACNTFSMINSKKERFWIRFHFVSQQGWEGINQTDAALLAGECPNYLSRDVRMAVQRGDFPRWKMNIQVMTEAEGYTRPEAFDCTKIWKHDEFPLIEIGEIEVNEWPEDYFTTTEQVAFSPANVPPGISFSPDKLLQGRLMLYDTTQHHRLGPAFKQLPINAPHGVCPMTIYTGRQGNNETNVNKYPHFWPSVSGKLNPDPSKKDPPVQSTGPIDYYPAIREGTDEDYYQQPREFLKATSEADRQSLIENLGNSLAGVDNSKVISLMLEHFNKINSTFGDAVAASIKEYQTGKRVTPGQAVLQRLNSRIAAPPVM